MSRNYSFIYKKLVSGDNDFIGQIAYSIYKRKKIKFIEDFKNEHGKDPSNEELDAFHVHSMDDEMIFAFKKQAEQILQEFINNTLTEEISAIEERTLSNQENILKDIISPLKPSSFWKQYWFGVFQGISATIAVSIIIMIIVLISLCSKYGVIGAGEHLFNIKITKDTIQTSQLKVIDTTKKTSITQKK